MRSEEAATVLTDVRRLFLVMLGALSAAVAVLALFRILNGRSFLSGCVVSTPLGWTIPIASAFVILGVGWLLLSQAPKGPRDAGRSYVACSSCARSVLTDWRLCPYCGETLEPEPDPTGQAVQG
jgi:hypothetical protein